MDGIDQYFDVNNAPLFSEPERVAIRNIFLFPNVELRMLPVTGAKRLINIHCLFNPEYVRELDNDFFGHLENPDGVKMNRHGITSYGRKLRPDLIDDAGAYRYGMENFAIEPGRLKSLMEANTNFSDNTIVVVSNSNKDDASGLQQHYDLFEADGGSMTGVRLTIYRLSDAIFSNNPKDIAYFLGEAKDDTPGVTETQKAQERQRVFDEQEFFKSCVTGCDAHTEADLCTRFTWLKATTNFAGLRQIMYEAAQRVKIQPDEPDQKDGKLIIDQVRFVCPDATFNPDPIQLNANLNVIIGGKSSGKSILLYNIARTLLPDRQILKPDKISGAFKYEFGDSFDFEVTICAGQTQLMKRPDDQPSILPEIKYIPQNYLIQLADPESKKGNELVELIRDLLMEDHAYKRHYDEFLGRLKTNDSQIERLINRFFELSDTIAGQRKELLQKGDGSVLSANISANETKIRVLQAGAGLTEQEINDYQEMGRELTALQGEITNIEGDFAKISVFHEHANSILSELVERKNLVQQSLQALPIEGWFTSEFQLLELTLRQIETLASDISMAPPSPGQSANIFVATLQTQREAESALKQKQEPLLAKFANKAQIEILEKQVAEDQQKINEILHLGNEISANELAKTTTKEAIFLAYGQYFTGFTQLVTTFSPRTDSLKKDRLNIIGKTRFNFPKFGTQVESLTDNRSFNRQPFPILWSSKDAIADFSYDDLLEELEVMFAQVAESGTMPLVSKADPKTVVKTLLKGYLFDYWDVEYDQDHLTHMSAGKASFVILMLIVGLSKSKAPILIDQPEDNLDNRSITKDLVQYLKNKKLERQIILVTHNANVVVNADAENIIVANQRGQNDRTTTSRYRFDYINGPLEYSKPVDEREKDLLKCMGIRQHVTDIVEGGDEAFWQRERKYGQQRPKLYVSKVPLTPSQPPGPDV